MITFVCNAPCTQSKHIRMHMNIVKTRVQIFSFAYIDAFGYGAGALEYETVLVGIDPVQSREWNIVGVTCEYAHGISALHQKKTST